MKTTAVLTLKRVEDYAIPGPFEQGKSSLLPRWALFWPDILGGPAFTYLTHDELQRFPGLPEVLAAIHGESKYDVSLTLDIAIPDRKAHRNG